jgi:20S proteasome subunit beta 6
MTALLEAAPISHHGKQSRFNPYQDNGGTVLAIAGENYAVVVADDRVSKGYSICTRQGSKITQLTSKCVIATSGMLADQLALHKLMKIKVGMYQHEHGSEPSTPAVAQMLSVTLYGRRFFPFYTFNLLVGLDDEGKGAVYGYDAIGSFERMQHGSQGTGKSLVQSILDNQVSKNNQLIKGAPLTVHQAVDLCKDVITSAAERDIYTGDAATVVVMTAKDVLTSKLELRKD